MVDDFFRIVCYYYYNSYMPAIYMQPFTFHLYLDNTILNNCLNK